MLHRLLERLELILGFKTVLAHCDIPCGIYDPHKAQMDAHTVIRMVDMIKDPKNKGDIHKLARYTKVKEEHAESCKHEVRVLWGDYFKEEHAKQFPELNELIWKIMKQASNAKQTTDRRAGEDLLSSVQRLSEIFWQTKGKETIRVQAPYPSGGEIILHK